MLSVRRAVSSMICRRERRWCRLSLFVLGLACLLGKTPADASDSLTLYMYYLPHRLTEDSGRQYDRFLEVLFDRTGLAIERKSAPLLRASNLFRQDQQSCIFPSNIRALKLDSVASRFGTSDTVDIVSLRLYTAKRQATAAALADFRPERVGYIRGSGAVHFLGENSDQYVPIASEEQLIRMLELDRIDAFLGHHPDTALALEDLDRPDALHVSPVAPDTLRFPITFVCHDSAVSRAFLKTVNSEIARMHASGVTRDIFGKHAEFEQPDEHTEEVPLTE